MAYAVTERNTKIEEDTFKDNEKSAVLGWHGFHNVEPNARETTAYGEALEGSRNYKNRKARTQAHHQHAEHEYGVEKAKTSLSAETVSNNTAYECSELTPWHGSNSTPKKTLP